MSKLIHLHNSPALLTDAQLKAYRQGGFRGAKLMPEQGADHVAQLQEHTPSGLFAARLADTQVHWDSIEEQAQLWVGKILELMPLGVWLFQCDNEPNLQHPVGERWQWQWRMIEVIKRVRALLKDHWAQAGYSDKAIQALQYRVQLYLAPIAWGPGKWQDVESNWLAPAAQVLPYVQGICVNSYWQYRKHTLYEGYGGSPAYWHRWAPNHRIFVAEWACSLCDKWGEQGRKSPTNDQLIAIEAEMLASYPEWLRWAQGQPYIVGSALFIEPGSSGWAGFEPSGRVLDTIHPL